MFKKLTKKSDAPKYLMRLFDKSKRSREVSGASDCHGTAVSALFGRPSACNGVSMPKNASRWTRLISPDDITNPCSETFSKIRASLRNVTFFNVQSNSDTEYRDRRKPLAICSNPWISPLHRSVCGISQPHSKYRLFSLMFGHFQSLIWLRSIKIDFFSIFLLRESALLYNFALLFDCNELDFVGKFSFDSFSNNFELFVSLWLTIAMFDWLIVTLKLSVLWLFNRLLCGVGAVKLVWMSAMSAWSIVIGESKSPGIVAFFSSLLSINDSFIYVELMVWMTSNTLSRCNLRKRSNWPKREGERKNQNKREIIIMY